jgi:hypothetical protein
MDDDLEEKESNPNSVSDAPEGLELTQETSPAPESSERAQDVSSLIEEIKKRHENLEEIYPGITEQLRRFVEADLPACRHCGSTDTASVQVGTVGRAAIIGEATRKVKLVPTAAEKLGAYFCNQCEKYFN